MPTKTIAKFEVEWLQIIDENGRCDEKLMPELSREQLLKMYQSMILGRIFDDTALKLQREGRILTYASHHGQEAQVGAAFAMSKDDWLFPSFRENAAHLALGMPAEQLFLYWGGDERGMKIPENVNTFVVAVPVGTQIPHAVGFGLARKFQKRKGAAVVFFGDGGTSTGDFHESMNLAGVFKAPVVFICQNNQWAISLPVSNQTSAETIAQKAIAYGFKGVRVDGNDVLAIYKAVSDALVSARKGEPMLVECLTYRISDHTTADDASRYRTQKEVESWIKKDPITRFEKYLFSKKILDQKTKDEILANAQKQIEKSVKVAENTQPAQPDDIFKFTYSELTENLIDQYEEAKEAWSLE